MRSAAGVWTLDGAAVSGLEACVDLDLGFTPATNLLQIRRLALALGSIATRRRFPSGPTYDLTG